MASSPDRNQKPGDGHPARRLKLTMPSAKKSQISPPASSRDHSSAPKEQSRSPSRPSYSPVTPTLSQASLVFPQTQQNASSQTQWIAQPESLPVNDEENPDAMAMSAAISILQMQRQQALRDMKGLDKMKKAALDDPPAFVEDLKAGKLAPAPRTGIDVDGEASDEDRPMQSPSTDSQFGRFPAAQNVVRAPPIEWAKYHVVGEPLNRMHEVQRRYPGFKEESLDAVPKPQPHTVASPYRPFADKLDEPSLPS